MRTLKHLVMPNWLCMRAFSAADLAAIESAISASEASHRGELRLVIEGSLPLPALRAASRARAEQLFSDLRVWDTAENSGVLIYVQLVDRRIEIVADRGIAAKVAQPEWDAICRTMEASFAEKEFKNGALAAIGRATALLAAHFPARPDNPDELPNQPVVIR